MTLCKFGHNYEPATVRNRAGCTVCNKLRSAKYRRDNPEKVTAAYHSWLERNKQRKADTDRQYRMNLPRTEFLSRCRRYAAKRNALLNNATPSWLTSQHYAQIALFYDAAVRLSQELGIAFEVDHIIPISGEHVSGLHVPWNLQVLPATDNREKSNKYDLKFA